MSQIIISKSKGKGRKQKRPTTALRHDPLLDEKSQPLKVAIKGLIKPATEMHYSDIASASYVADTTGTVTALNLIAEGNDNVSRLGRKAHMRSVSVKGFVSLPVATVALLPGQQSRVLLVWDNAANGALPAIADVLTAANSTAFLNVNNVARFTILHDQVINLGELYSNGGATAGWASIATVDITKHINAPTEYMGTTAAIGSVQNGSLLLLTMGSKAASADTASFTLASRVTFTDVL